MPNRLTRTLVAVLLTATAVSAQTLAHPGMDPGVADRWWQHAVFYQTGPGAQPEAVFKDLATRLDALRSLGVDALLVPAPNLPAQPTSIDDPALNALDELIHQASFRGIRVLLTLPATMPDPSSTARFWFSRGVAGFHIPTAPGASPTSTIVQDLRRITSTTVGQRIVLSDFDPSATIVAIATPRRTARRIDHQADSASAQLQIDARLSLLPTVDATNLRPILAETLTQSNVLLDIHQPAPNPELAKAIASVLLGIHPATILDASTRLTLPVTQDGPPDVDPQNAARPVPPVPLPTPPPPGVYVPYVPYVPPPRASTASASPASQAPPSSDPLTDWYGQLSALHHGNATLRLGTPILLNFDPQNALVWAIRPATNSLLTPPVVVLCNLSSTPVQLALSTAIKNLDLHGTYLRTLLRSDKSIGPQDINSVVLPPYGVYIGELHR